MNYKEIKLLQEIRDNNEGFSDPVVREAYRSIPNAPLGIDFPRQRMIIAINRYFAFNQEQLEYDLRNSQEEMNIIENQYYNEVTPTLLEITDIRLPINELPQIKEIDANNINKSAKPKRKPKRKVRKAKINK